MAEPDKAIKAMTAARSNMTKAWAAAKYIIANSPPPVATDSRVKVGARTSGGAIAGATPYADQFATTGAVLALQHTVASTAIAMMDNAGAPLLSSLNTTMFAALNARDAAVAYLHSIEPPPPVGDAQASKAKPSKAKAKARTSGAPVAAGWSSTMQNVGFDVNDELLQVDGVRALVNLSPSRKRLLDLAEIQDTRTSRTINRYWPPVVGG
jgi:hypothetical protein